MRHHTSLALLLAAGGVGLLASRPIQELKSHQELESIRAAALPEKAERFLAARRSALELDERHSFKTVDTQVDNTGATYHRLEQRFQGLRVYGGEVVVRKTLRGTEEIHANALCRNIDLNPEPTVGAAEIRALSVSRFAPHMEAHAPGRVELIVYPIRTHTLKANAPSRPYGPNAEDFETRVTAYRLAYFVRNTELLGDQGPRRMVHILDAHTGQLIDEWNDLHTDQPVKGTGKSQYNGTVNIDTNRNTSGQYELRDMTRGSVQHPWTKLVGNQTNNLNNKGKVDAQTGQYAEDPGLGTLYGDADNTWGDGTNYSEGSDTNAPQGQTGGVDTHYGVAMTWDMYRNVFGRNGIDGKGTSALNRVHFAHGDTVSEANAFWIGYDASDPQACFCMTYGDGANDWLYGINFKEMTCLDVAGHELTHGVCETTANLAYSKDAGGLNEANSDIFGTLVEFYVRGAGGTGTTLPDTGGNWLIGNELSGDNKPLRWMIKPSKDGRSFDYWESGFNTSSDSQKYDPHFTSGPMNRCFYYMSQGSTATTSADDYSKYLTSGMAGIGNHKAAQIWFRALLKLTTNATYLDARNAAIQSAKELYGAGGAEEQAMWNAFGGINVGSIWSGGGPATLSASITSPASSVTVATGTAVSFTGTASGGTSPYTYGWNFGDGGTATSASASHTFTNSGSANVNYTVTFTAKDNVGASASATRIVTVTPAGGGGTGTEKMVNGGFESGTSPWGGTTGDIGAWTNQAAHGGSRCAWLMGNGTYANESLYQNVGIPSTAASATLTFWMHIDTAETTTSTAYDKLRVQVLNTSGTVLKTLATYSNLNKNAGYVQKSFDLSAFKGQTVRIRFSGSEDWSKQTSFVIDDVSLQVK